MSDNSSSSSGGIGLFGAMFILFLALKLGVADTGVQDWSWWLVTAPLWGPFLFIIVIGLIFLLIALVTGGNFTVRRKGKVYSKQIRGRRY